MRFARYSPFILAGTVLTISFATAQPTEQSDSEWFTSAQSELQKRLAREYNTNQAKNIILLISDGHGVATNYATRLYTGQREGGGGEAHVLPFETTDYSSALVKTYNTNAQTPDSAGTATAIMSGIKTRAGVINVNQNVVPGDCTTLPGNRSTPLSRLLAQAGKSVGAVSTAGITHATPATVYANSADRDWEANVPNDCPHQRDIADQLVQSMQAGEIDLAMGGGRHHFVPEDEATVEDGQGRRRDDRNLVEQAQQQGFQYAWDQSSFEQLDTDGAPVLGLFEDSHMQYELDRDDEPSLSEMTETAIRMLSENEDGFFLQVEAGRVDHAHHAGNLARTLADAAEFAKAVARADEMTSDQETLIIVTADHAHALGFNGYCGRGSDILGLCMGIDPANDWHTGTPNLASDDKPYTVAGYLNGRGSVFLREGGGQQRPAPKPEQINDPDYMQQALIPMSSESHSGEDVAVYAKGPFAHLFDGTVEQHYLFHVMRHAATAD